MSKITKISITPGDIIQTNRDFLNSEDQEYDTLYGILKTRKQINRVSESDIQRVIGEFPYNEDLIDQCALWIHALVGKHFFPDANHRTAIATLRSILDENNINIWKIKNNEIKDVISKSKTERRKLSISIDKIYQRDNLFSVWKEYFERYY